MSEFLLEIRSEEIPARMQARAAEDLRRLVTARLTEAGLAFAAATSWVTPRRLVLAVEGLPAAQPDQTVERKGPRGNANETAIKGFLDSVGLRRDQVELRETDRGAFLFAVLKRPGRPTPLVLAEIVPAVLATFPWPKSMRWGTTPFRWVRPIHSLIALFAGRPLPGGLALAPGAGPGDAAFIPFGATTVGHRFLSGGAPIEVASAADLYAKLRAAHVLLDAAERRATIQGRAEALAQAEGLILRPDPALLDEVVGLVEWPVVLMGRIDPAFMALPPEVLTTSMRTHQKYFALQTADGALAPRFIVVANTAAADGGRAIVAGNERVLRARLSDARFFWDQDRRQRLEERVPALSRIVFHAALGTLGDKVARLQALAAEIAPAGCDPALARTAALLAKADLVTGMVGEFPELQGIMGRYYALHDGERPEVAAAIAEHYSPAGPNDRCPSAPIAVAIALADKLDTLAGFFAIGEFPTGSKDPFALRRAALGVIRLIIENGLRLPLRPLLLSAVTLYQEGGLGTGPTPAAVADALLDFFADRLKVHLRDRGVRHDLVEAVFAVSAEDDLVRLLAKVEALAAFLGAEDGANLLTAFRRASNIVRIEEKKDGRAYSERADPALLVAAEEKALQGALVAASTAIGQALAAERFVDAMVALARLRVPVDAFFDRVTVNADDPQHRINRLRLLSQIRSALGAVADFARIEG
ncbi:MAG: glycine--tRNA ligase subunit beta [Alphaproteobacteria bacterium]|nr:glycine--tRNA ligase subunit beta [Alphaproteobacteria bacterium]